MVLTMAGEDTTAFWEEELSEAYRTGSIFAALSVHLWQGFTQWHAATCARLCTHW